MKKVLVIMLLLLTTVACASTRRRERYVEYYTDTTPIIKEKILAGRIMVGMIKQEVTAAWGEPDSSNKSTYAWGTSTQWVYRYTTATSYVYFKNGLLTSWQKSIHKN